MGAILVAFGFFVLNAGADRRITGIAYSDRVGHGLINTLLSGATSGATYYLLQRLIEGKWTNGERQTTTVPLALSLQRSKNQLVI